MILAAFLVALGYYWIIFPRSIFGYPAPVISFEVTPAVETILEKEVGLYRYLPPNIRRTLHRRVERFLSEVEIGPSAELPELSTRMKIGIAGQACLLLLTKRRIKFDGLRSIVVYPGFCDYNDMAGHSSISGVITVAIQSSRLGGRDPKDGYNVILHEFAHQLDFENPFLRGMPMVANIFHWPRWVRCLSCERRRLKRGEQSGLFNHLRTHPAARDPHEFFAYSVEHFFERPHETKAEHPELYALLVAFFEIDPGKYLPRT